jgi:hypothetical protein
LIGVVAPRTFEGSQIEPRPLYSMEPGGLFQTAKLFTALITRVGTH